MEIKHYLGTGLLLISLTVCYELYSQKRHQEVIAAVHGATAGAVATGFEQERARDQLRREEQNALDRQTQGELIEQTRAAAASAVSDQFKKERAVNDARAKRVLQQARQASLLSEGLMLATQSKLLVSEHYLDNGEFPDSNDQVGLPPPHTITATGVSRIEVSWNGVIIIGYNQKTGIEDGEVTLRPTFSPTRGILWECESRSFSGIERYMPQCRYTG